MSHPYANDTTHVLLVTAENDQGTYRIVADLVAQVLARFPDTSDATLGGLVRHRLRVVCEDAHHQRALPLVESQHAPDRAMLADLYRDIDWRHVDAADVGAWARGLVRETT